MNVYYSSVKEVSGGQLDIYVYPVDIIYPAVSSIAVANTFVNYIYLDQLQFY